MKVFTDSDVIISSLISSSGASHLLLESAESTKFFVSNISTKELKKVIRHFKVDKILKDFNIIVTTPGKFLQYLRSQS